MSKEHVWPDWVTRQLPPELLGDDYTYVFENSDGEFRRVAQQPLFQMRVSGVCRTCNSEWMSRREEAAKVYAAGILAGRGRQLHREGQVALAAWGALKAFVAQLGFRDEDPHGRIPVEDYHELYQTRDEPQLPATFTVYTGKTAWSSRRAAAGFYRLNGIAIGGQKRGRQDGYVLTFTVLDLLIQVVRVFGDDRAAWVEGPGSRSSLAQIWPARDSFVWPPGPPLTKADVLRVAGPDPA